MAVIDESTLVGSEVENVTHVRGSGGTLLTGRQLALLATVGEGDGLADRR